MDACDATEQACRRCGAMFVPSQEAHVFCSARCRKAIKRQQRRKRGYPLPPKVSIKGRYDGTLELIREHG